MAMRGPGSTCAFGPPRAIVTFPTMREPALGPDGRHPSVTGYVNIAAILTGDPNAASNVMMVSVDGEAPHSVAMAMAQPIQMTVSSIRRISPLVSIQ